MGNTNGSPRRSPSDRSLSHPNSTFQGSNSYPVHRPVPSNGYPGSSPRVDYQPPPPPPFPPPAWFMVPPPHTNTHHYNPNPNYGYPGNAGYGGNPNVRPNMPSYYYPQHPPPPAGPWHGGYPGERPTGGALGGAAPYVMSPAGAFQPAPAVVPQNAPPQVTQTIRNDVNLRRGTLKLVRDPENAGQHLVTFEFDSSVAGSVCIFFLAREGESLSFTSLRPDLYTPIRVPFPQGLSQTFKQAPGTGIDLSKFSQAELALDGRGDAFTLVVRTEAVPRNAPPDTPNGLDAPPGAKLTKWLQSQVTYGALEIIEGEVRVKVLKQKIWVDGVRYELKEIYGLEHFKGGDATADDANDSGKECVICLSAKRDTTVLPCRHMCMCHECAQVLRMQTNKCPICRQTVERLLEIRVPAGKDAAKWEDESNCINGVDKYKPKDLTSPKTPVASALTAALASSSGSQTPSESVASPPTPAVGSSKPAHASSSGGQA